MSTSFIFGSHHWDRLTGQLEELIRLEKESLEVSRDILRALRPPTEAVSMKWKNGGTNMPLIMPLGDQDTGFITVTIDNHDGKGPVAQAALPAGQTAQVVSADPATFTITMDSPAVADPDGTLTVGSFTVVSAAAPAQPNVAVGVTLNILNADGSVAATLSDTVTVSETATEAVGDIFGSPVAIPPAVSAKKK